MNVHIFLVVHSRCAVSLVTGPVFLLSCHWNTGKKMSESIRILVVDDHPIVRDGLVAILTTQPDFEVVGEAPNGTEAVERAHLLHPDLLLLDLAMPGMDGVEVI